MPRNTHLMVTPLAQRDGAATAEAPQQDGTPPTTRTRLRPLSEQGVVEAVIEFANLGNFRSWMSLRQGTRWELDASPDSPMAKDLRTHFSEERAVLRASLTAIVMNQVGADRIALWSQRASCLILTPHFSYQDGRLRVEHRHQAGQLFDSPPNCQFSYALLLLLDVERPYGRDLCQCRLPSCGDFFFAKRPATGRPQRLYCAHEHLLRAHAANAPARVRRSRLNKKRALNVKGKRRA
jgi:hypothetical protein